jgi:glycosyltransferase involved in cell wall biosynthesis
VKILFATHFFPPGHLGGTESYTLGLAQALRRMGHETYVVCAENFGVGASWSPRHVDTVYDGIPVRRLSWNWEQAPDPFVDYYRNAPVAEHVGAYLRELRPDVVHITSCYTLGAGIIGAAREAGIPIVATLTDFWFICPRTTLQRGDGTLCDGPRSAVDCQRCQAVKTRVYRALTTVLPADQVAAGLLAVSRVPSIARLRGFRGYVGDAEKRVVYLRGELARVDRVLAPSRFLWDMFVRNGFPADRIDVSPYGYGIDVAWLQQLRERPSGGPIRIGYIGQIDHIKGVDVLVKAFLRAELGDRAELRIHGDMSKRPAFAADLERLAAGSPAVQFGGPFDRAAIADVMSELDLIVVPSVWYENAPVTISEAFAARRPVVATNLGGMSDLVEHEVNGLLFEKGDVQGLTDSLRRLVLDQSLRERLRSNIRSPRTIDDDAQYLVQTYGEIAATRGSRMPVARR